MEGHENTWDIKTLKARLEKCLGKEASDLIFKTLKHVYKLDEETLVKDPYQFEQKIRSMLGDSTTDIILKEIAKAER